MHYFAFASEQNDLPRPGDPDGAEGALERWREAAQATGEPEVAAAAEALCADGSGRRLLEAVFGNSPFLTQAAVADPAFARALLADGPDPAFRGVMENLVGFRKQSLDEAGLAAGLRVAKRRVALAVAVADITGAWPLERVTGALSDFADASLGCALAHLLRAAAANGAFVLEDDNDPERGCGFILLGVGKLGGRELNYSSDVDLIAFFDRDRIRTDAPEQLQNAFVRLVRNLVRMMENRTADGYVFRTDFRLRPDPAAMPLAVSTNAAETYYETLGQNWERAALIKARPVAGDREAGEAFLSFLRPFLWRRHLDFAAIQDIHSIKRQIVAHRGGGTIALGGHNVKLGRGGIREIEFFAQTQQLIWGGRSPALRCRGTEEALRALTAEGRVADDTAQDLIAAYRFLRRVEHRLQMIDDEQTHTLPEDPEGLRRLAVFLGYADTDAFAADLTSHLKRVEVHYARLFEDAPALGAAGDVTGNLVFTGADTDSETIKTLSGLGYGNPDIVDQAVRGWHHGHYRATRSTRARQLLTELMPGLLTALARTPDPDAAFLKFDEFLSRLPSGVQLFSLFHSNPQLLDLVAEIMGAAPRLAERLSRRPLLLDSVLSADFPQPPPSREVMVAELAQLLERSEGMEGVLDTSRRWANERKFQVGVQALRGTLAPEQAAGALSDVAEATLACLLPCVQAEFARHHGKTAAHGLAVVALGKLGAREMTSNSDLDLIFIYESGPAPSDGARPLPASQYFARLCQRLINALSALTAEGRLYEVDMRLRPSGQSGPIACSLDAFVQYHAENAWTWEHMALTRARAVAGPPGLTARVDDAIRGILTRPRDADALCHDVAHMRARMDAEHHTDFVWDVKFLRGGLVDIEFVAQYLQLKHADAHPEVLSPGTRQALQRLQGAGLLDPAVARDLIEALDLWQPLQAMLRLTFAREFSGFREGDVPRPLQDILARIGGSDDFVKLKGRVAVTAAKCYSHFQDLIGDAPAKSREKDKK